MTLILAILTGPFARKKLELWESQTIRVGRTARADFVIPHDTFLSSLHFAVSVTNASCLLRDLGSTNGTFLNEVRVQEAVLKEGDLIRAGETSFSVSIVAADPSPSRVALQPSQPSEAPRFAQTRLMDASPFQNMRSSKAGVLQFLTSRKEPLFGLLDAARDSRVLDFLRAGKDQFQSLYQGATGDELESVAPYLVELPKDSALLSKLVEKGWGKSWGVYLTSGEAFPEVRKHLRRFLTATTPEGKQLLFRFYDPRVLRVYLPTCEAQEKADFFGPVMLYVVEGEEPDDILLYPAPESSRGHPT